MPLGIINYSRVIYKDPQKKEEIVGLILLRKTTIKSSLAHDVPEPILKVG